MTKPKPKNHHAAEMARARWKGVPKAERSRLAKAAIKARWDRVREAKKLAS